MHALVSEFQKHHYDRHKPESLLLSDLREMSDHRSQVAMLLLRRGDGRATRSLICINNLAFLMFLTNGDTCTFCCTEGLPTSSTSDGN